MHKPRTRSWAAVVCHRPAGRSSKRPDRCDAASAEVDDVEGGGAAAALDADEARDRIDAVERMQVGSRRSHLSVSLDGEVVSAAPPLEYRIRKKALRVIAP